jgi:hypothetical protein
VLALASAAARAEEDVLVELLPELPWVVAPLHATREASATKETVGTRMDGWREGRAFMGFLRRAHAGRARH